MDKIEIRGYKSIKKTEIELNRLNILIGANGSGKSNFISFFKFLNALYEQRLREYIAINGGKEKFYHKGITPHQQQSSISKERIGAHIVFKNAINAYSFSLADGNDSLIFTNETLWYYNRDWNISNFSNEANVKSDEKHRAKYIQKYLSGLRKYHFHDTGKNSPFNETSHSINDRYFLYERGENLSAFLLGIKEEYPLAYKRIVKTIQRIAPFFSDFYFNVNQGGYLRLQWQDKYSSTIYGVSDLSDGTIRFIALTTLFLQPNLPDTIIIDEPELGLHPVAIAKLAGMMQSAKQKKAQIIAATQSSDLVSHFEPKDVITVDLVDGESIYQRLEEDRLDQWIEEYALGDLWSRNIIEGGQP